MPGEKHLAIQMHELLAFLNQRGVVTLMVMAQSGMAGGQMAAPVDLSYLADNVMMFRFFEAEGRVRKALSIVKKRSGEHEDTIRELQMKGGNIVIGQALSNFRGMLTGVPTLIKAGPSSQGQDA
jgi:circadian clock protein KaiC